MNSRKFLLHLALFIGLGGVGPTLRAQQPLDSVPIEYRPPTLVVQASVNGSEPLPFAFDTGTTTCLIDYRVAQRLQIPIGGPGFARARTTAVGRAVARDLELIIRDLAPLAKQTGVELAGILGFTWMENFVFRIDTRSGRLTLWPRTVELTPTAEELPFPLELQSGPRFSGASIFVPATLEGEHRCRMLIDTGTDKSIFGRELARSLGLRVQPIEKAEPGKPFPVHTVSRVEFAGRTFTNVPFVFDPRRGAGSDPYDQCVVGNNLLNRFVITFDLPRRRVFFRPLLPLPEAKD